MFELTINDKVYSFNFGFGFMREIDPKVKKEIDGVKGKTQDVGVQFTIASILDGDLNELVNALEAANKGCDPRITRKEIESYIENEDTDIDGLFADVLGFLERANCTKKTVANLKEIIEKEKAKAAAKTES